jgi:hypothetical protein
MNLGESLHEHLTETVAEWYRNPPTQRGSDLYVILIADNRSILLVFQREYDKVNINFYYLSWHFLGSEKVRGSLFLSVLHTL